MVIFWCLKGGSYEPTAYVQRREPPYLHPERGASSPEEFCRRADARRDPAVSIEEILEALGQWLERVLAALESVWKLLD